MTEFKHNMLFVCQLWHWQDALLAHSTSVRKNMQILISRILNMLKGVVVVVVVNHCFTSLFGT